MPSEPRRERELILAPNEYAYVLDTTKGHVNCYVGPNKTSLAQTDQPVVFDAETKRFTHVGLSAAVQLFATAPANWYLVLKNPARDGGHPKPGMASSLSDLDVGRKILVPGPASFPLWPGQMVKVIEGHRLRSDQYLYIRIYDAAAAEAVRAQVLGGDADDEAPFVVGQVRVIRGVDTRFYIPPTGVEVVPDRQGRLVRDAVSLRRLEYCVLIGEDGRRRCLRGEAVVVPEPGQRFLERRGRRKFAAIELSGTTGLHVKVVAPYTEPDGTERSEGEELFLTGESVIWFPREEQTIIRQGGRTLHQAVAIPRGEGRYVLDRASGEVRLQRGPCMFLPDPRREVIVRRVLSTRECALLYPGNDEALRFNRALRGGEAPARRARIAAPEIESVAEVGDEIERSDRFDAPRTITLDNRFDGAVRVDVWAGFAVQVVDRGGQRRVEQGPTTVLLGYDESLQALSLSTGTPKSDRTKLDTAYLRTAGNKVTDEVEITTRDLVQATLTVTYRVRFAGTDPSRWFAVEDYVKLLCDHAGSMLKGGLRRRSVRDLQAEVTGLVRDLLLGARSEEGERPGLRFAENGMEVHDVEVLDLTLADPDVEALLDAAQQRAIEGAMEVAAREAELDEQRRIEAVERALAEERHATAELREALERARVERAHAEAEAKRGRDAALQALDHTLRKAAVEAEHAVRQVQTETTQAEHAASMVRKKDRQALELELLAAQVDAARQAAEAFQPELVSALKRLGDQELLGQLAENFSELAAVEGRGLLEVARRYLDFVPTALVPVLQHEGEGG